ncbi:MAG: DUF167 domain-containing protein [Chloroflexi bacterium]|nr:DUF167 domain-containing protein [Chloroflexota bacterium]
MSSRKYKLHDGQSGAALTVRLTAKASRNAVAGILEDGTIKIHVTASPDKGQDNMAMTKLLAGVLSIPEKDVAIIAGETGRDKLVSILSLDAAAVTKRIREHI